MSGQRQAFNPLDTLLHVTDQARRTLQIPGGDIFVFCEFDGQLDRPGLARALTALLRRYPTLGSRLQPGTWLRTPHWLLPTTTSTPELRVQPRASDARFNEWFGATVDWTRSPALLVSHYQGENDALVFRWPHFLMDGVGGANLVDVLGQLYDEQVDPEAVSSVGDEQRDDFGTLTLRPPPWPWQSVAPKLPTQPTGATLRLADAGPVQAGDTALRLTIRRLTSAQAADVRQAALGCCGFGRFAEYLRATGIAVLDQQLRERGDVTDGGVYTTFHLLDNRRRKDIGPLCHNVFSTLPIAVRATDAADRSATADLIQEATRAALTTDWLQQRLDRLAWLARLPVPLIAKRIVANWRRGATPTGLGPGNPPSMPLGFTGPLRIPRETLCGARLRNLFGAVSPAPTAGFSVNVNAAQDRMNVAVAYNPRRLPDAAADRLADAYVEALMA